MATNRTRAASAVLAAALAMTLALAAPTALAEEAPAQMELAHTYMKSEGDKDVPADRIVKDGKTWNLVRTKEEPDPDWNPKEVSFEKASSVECLPEDLEAVKASMPEEHEVDEDGVAGSIPRTGLFEEPFYATVPYQAERLEELSGLPDNDVSRIEPRKTFVLDTGNTVELARAGVTWEPEGFGPTGLATSYAARVLYRGVDEATVLDHYTVTATYAGIVAESEDERMLVTAVYEAEPVPEPAAEPEPQPEPEPDFPWPAIAGAAAAAAAVVGGAALFWRSRNVKVVADENGAERIVGSLRAKRLSDGSLEVEVPGKYDLAAKRYELVLRPDIAAAPSIKMSHMGLEAVVAPARRRIVLNEEFSKR